MSVETSPPVVTPPGVEALRIDFLFLDLTACTRCRGTDRSLSEALSVAAGLLEGSGLEVAVNKVHVTTEEIARAWRFVSSPTLRIDGTDIALELRESSCGSEACTDGCGDHIACRVWVYQGQEYTEPPTSMIVDAILRHVYSASPASQPTAPYTVPENLQRFFAGKAASIGLDLSSATETHGVNDPGTACCSPTDHQTCCDPSAKHDCCGGLEDQGCGCR